MERAGCGGGGCRQKTGLGDSRGSCWALAWGYPERTGGAEPKGWEDPGGLGLGVQPLAGGGCGNRRLGQRAAEERADQPVAWVSGGVGAGLGGVLGRPAAPEVWFLEPRSDISSSGPRLVGDDVLQVWLLIKLGIP